MRYESTRSKTGDQKLTFEEACFTAFAKDGGIMLPETLPKINESTLREWFGLDYVELAFRITSLFIDEKEVPRADLKQLLVDSFSSFTIPEKTKITRLQDDLYVAELYYGPTFTFKDYAMMFTGNMVDYFLRRKNKRMTVLISTSGDTGSAAIHAVKGKPSIELFVLYPGKGRISPIQEKQMSTIKESNIHVYSVDGTSDDIDNILKPIYSDDFFKSDFHVGSINSINWCRVMMQIVNYFFSYFRVLEHRKFPISNPGITLPKIVFSVPSGAFGNGVAGSIALQMGLPVKSILVANNDNDTLARLFATGELRANKIVQTLSPAIDIGVPYNLERFLFYLLNADTDAVRSLMTSFETNGSLRLAPPLLKKAQSWIDSLSVSNPETRKTIKDILSKYKYLIDPHTAVAVKAAQKRASKRDKKDTDEIVCCLSTAHPAKFEQTVGTAIGKKIELPPALAQLHSLPSFAIVLGSDFKQNETILRKDIQTFWEKFSKAKL